MHALTDQLTAPPPLARQQWSHRCRQRCSQAERTLASPSSTANAPNAAAGGIRTAGRRRAITARHAAASERRVLHRVLLMHARPRRRDARVRAGGAAAPSCSSQTVVNEVPCTT